MALGTCDIASESCKQPLVQHGIGNFHESGDVSAINEGARPAIGLGRLKRFLADLDHDFVQSLIHLFDVQLSPMPFCAISSPDVATPPALAAFAGPYRMPACKNMRVASSALGIFAPSATSLQPFINSVAASFSLISFWVALGKPRASLWRCAPPALTVTS